MLVRSIDDVLDDISAYFAPDSTSVHASSDEICKERAFQKLEMVSSFAAQKTARAILVRLVVVKAANTQFSYGLHVPDQTDDPAAILCSGCHDDTVSIGIKSDGSFEAFFGGFDFPQTQDRVLGSGDVESLDALVRQIVHGRISNVARAATTDQSI